MFQKQTAKGTPAVPRPRTPTRSRSRRLHRPVRTIDQLAETDASRDQGVSFARSGGVEGTPECYVRDASIGALLFYALGADARPAHAELHAHAHAGELDPVRHLLADIADTLFEQYQDCFVSSLTIRAGRRRPAHGSRRRQRPPVHAPDGGPFGHPGDPAPVRLRLQLQRRDGHARRRRDRAVSSFELTIDNNVTRQQTDDFVPYDVVAGQRQVSLSFDLIFETLAEYNKFHYGSRYRHHAVLRDLHHLGRLPVRQRREQPGQVHAAVHRVRGVPGRAEHGRRPDRRVGARGRSAPVLGLDHHGSRQEPGRDLLGGLMARGRTGLFKGRPPKKR
jgi:hypothetical protein